MLTGTSGGKAAIHPATLATVIRPRLPSAIADAASVMDQRASERRSFVLYVARLDVDGARELCRIRNLSTGGLMAEASRTLASGSRVGIEIPCEGTIAGDVVWAKGLHVGVRFRSPLRSPDPRRPATACVEDLMMQHEYIMRLAGDLEAIVAERGPTDATAILHIRQRFTQTLRAHLKQEDWAVYPELLRSGDPRVVTTAQAFRDEMGDLDAVLTTYANRWISGAIAADWPGFRRETNALLHALRRRATREDTELYPLLANGATCPVTLAAGSHDGRARGKYD